MLTLANPIDADQLRLRHEFVALPGLVLTATEVARLLGLRVTHAAEMLASLESDGFLVRTPLGEYRRAEPSMS
jgi:DNA-binding IclR family transcriptional regulator